VNPATERRRPRSLGATTSPVRVRPIKLRQRNNQADTGAP
jgi:hypothetical protein